MGEPFIIEKPDKAAAQAEKFRKYIQTPVLIGVEVSFPGFDAYDVEPKTIPDVLAERPVIIFGKWRGTARGGVKITGSSGTGDFSSTLLASENPPDEKNAALRYLWARFRIQLLADYNNLGEDKERVDEVTQLGLKYNLLTQYTSFIAVDQRVRNKGGKQETVEVPAGNGVGTARAIARLYSVFAEGGRELGLGPEILDLLCRETVRLGRDLESTGAG